MDLCCCDLHKKQMKTWVRAKSLVSDMDFDHPDMASFAKRAFSSLKKSWDLQCSRCACCGKSSEDGANLSYGYEDEATPNGERAMCCFCRAAIEDHMEETSPQKIFGRGTGTEQDEWHATLALASDIGKGKSPIRGWQPGTPKTKKSGRSKASDYFPAKGEKADLEVCADGKVRPTLSKKELEKARWREKQRSLLLIDKIDVERQTIEDTSYFMADVKKRMLEDHDMATLRRMREMLMATGPRAVVADKGLEWRQKYVPSASHSIENERLMELELAHHAINMMIKLIENTNVAKPDVSADGKSASAPKQSFEEGRRDCTLNFSKQVVDRVRWGQICTRRLAATDTYMGGLRAGKEARSKVRSAWHDGLDPTMSVKDMIKKEAAASEKAEAEWNKAHEARLTKPTKPFKPQRQQQQKPQQQPNPQGGKKGHKKRKRGGRGRQRQQQQPPRVRLNTKSLAQVKPPKATTPFVRQPLAQKICYACGLTGHIKSQCPTNP